jgi:hypothetical protein
MSNQGPADGYRREYKSKGYVDQDGNVHRKFKDKQVTPRWIVVLAAILVGAALISASLGAALSTIVGWALGIAICVAFILRGVEMLIGERGIQAVGEWRDRQIDRKANRD